jgi:hypothetical protein
MTRVMQTIFSTYFFLPAPLCLSAQLAATNRATIVIRRTSTILVAASNEKPILT